MGAVIRGGLVIDGTGRAGIAADVALEGDRIAAIGAPGSLSGERIVDATGLVVAPGFIDIHTHHDAQVFWDPACTPSPLHGVTSVFAGNCGFTIAPLHNGAGDYLMHMLSRVEGMPLAALQQGVPWNWTTTADYLARVEQAQPVMNMGFHVGHSALRRSVMGAAAVGETASDKQITAMQALLAEGLSAGGMGFTTSWSATHCDDDGNPVPSRAAPPDEVVALAGMLAHHPGTLLEIAPTNLGFDRIHVDTMARMAKAAGKSINWSIYQPSAAIAELSAQKLAASDAARAVGADLYALMYPDVLRVRASFLGAALDSLPGWSKFLALPHHERIAVLRDPRQRADLDRLARSVRDDGTVHDSANWPELVLTQCFASATKRFEGRKLGDIASAEGRDPFDVLCDIVIADDLRTGFVPYPTGDDEASWELRVAAWRDPRVLLGGSDAGAHLDLITTADWATAFLAANRAREALPLEFAIHRITGQLAATYHLANRGILTSGNYADIVIFDPATIGPARAEWREDLPGGCGRMYAEAIGIAEVFVNGVSIVRDGRLTGARPGRVLRSGRDTY